MFGIGTLIAAPLALKAAGVIAGSAAVGGGLGWLATGDAKGAAVGAAGGAVGGGVGTVAGPAAGIMAGTTAYGIGSQMTAPKAPSGPAQGTTVPRTAQPQAAAQPDNPHNVPAGFPMPMPGMVRKRSSPGMAPSR